MLLLFAVITMPFVVLPFFIVSDGANVSSSYIPYMQKEITAADQSKYLLSSTQRRSGGVSLNQIRRGLNVGYDISVKRALREMGLRTAHFDAWIAQHPGTVLSHLRYMPVTSQQFVASTAVFIRKSNSRIDAKTAWREAAALVHYSAKYAVPYALTTAVAKVESTFDPDAISSKGASGVMQVMWDLHHSLLKANGITPAPGANPLADPEKAIAAGCLLISRYIRAYGSVNSAMERYYGTNSETYRRKVNRNVASVMNHHSQFFK
jgi:soluble lytic murein transglycosylase-like protein